MLSQTVEAKADAKAIAPYVVGCEYTYNGYARYTKRVQLCSIPNDDERGEWTPTRVGNALVDYVDGGWSPFGGNATLLDAGQLIFSVSVYTD